MRTCFGLFVAATSLVAGCKDITPSEPAGVQPPPADLRPSTRSGRPEPVEGRILSLTPNITEILFAMDLGDRVVGRSNYCTYPAEAAAIPAVGDTLHLNLEKIIALRPTVAFVVTRREDLPRTLEGLGIRCVPLESDTMPELLDSIRTIGREARTGAAAPKGVDAGARLCARLQGDLEAVRRRVAGFPRPRVLFAFPMTVGSAQMMVAGRGTFVDELLEVAGADNAYPDVAHWPTLSPQRAVALAPDVVLINATGDDAAPDRLEAVRRAWAGLTSIPAVANGRVVILTEPYLTIPGPRVGLAARRLADVIHPEVVGEKGTPP